MRPRIRTRDQRGAVLVEFALVLPILLVFFVGVVDFGLILREYQILQNGAREGARMSMMDKYNIAGGVTPAARTAIGNAIKQRVVDYMAAEQITIALANVTVDQTTVKIDIGGGKFAGASQITVSYTRSALIGNGWPFGPMTLRGQAIFRNLY
jgi:Flp pilus assembly protein TadG